jgi:hypothetical protein
MRRLRWPWVLLVVWVLALQCGFVPAVWIGLPVLRDTVEAGKGASSPFAAMLAWFYTFDNDDRDGARVADRIVIASERAKVAKIRAAFMDAKRADLAAHPEVTGAALSQSGPQPGMPPEEGYADKGTRANVLMYVEVTFYRRDLASTTGTGSGGQPWRAEARKERRVSDRSVALIDSWPVLW